MAFTVQITCNENGARREALRTVTAPHNNFELPCEHNHILPGRWIVPTEEIVTVELVPARIVWTRFCSSGGLFEGGCLSGFQG